jgi:hypothetical protein
VSTDRVSNEPGVGSVSLGSCLSTSGDDGAEIGETECVRCDDPSLVGPGPPISICVSTGETTTGDSGRSLTGSVTTLGTDFWGEDGPLVCKGVPSDAKYGLTWASLDGRSTGDDKWKDSVGVTNSSLNGLDWLGEGTTVLRVSSALGDATCRID